MARLTEGWQSGRKCFSAKLAFIRMVRNIIVLHQQNGEKHLMAF